MPTISRVLVSSCALAAVLMTGCARAGDRTVTADPPADQRAGESWFGAYLQGTKIGYMSEGLRPVERDGRKLLEYVSKNYAVIDVLGQRMEQTSVWVSLCDGDYHPVELQFTLKSGNRSQAVSAVFTPQEVRCTRTQGAQTVEQNVPVPDGVELVVDGQALANEGRVKVGETVTVHQFNPVTFEIEECKLTGQRREMLPLPGETVEALVIKMVTPMVEAEVWVDDAGRTLQVRSTMMQGSLEFRREERETALAGIDEGGPRVDLVVATAIRPSTPIVDSGNAARLVLKVQGLDRLRQVPSGGWQQVEPAVEGWRRVTIDAAPPPPKRLSLPLKSVPDDLREYLAPTTYIESDHPEMSAQAKGVLAGEHEVEAAIGLLRDWVHQRIRWQSDIGLFRSALEILRDPAGVCRDSAALYTALARAAGIPTRVCAGLVYVNGAFMGHAWAESWCGAWLPVDATRTGRFVDATHLKLAQGPKYTCVFEMLPALGALKIEVEQVTARAAE